MLSKTLKYAWPAFIIYCVIFYLCCMFAPSEVDIDVEVPHFDKVVHYFMYFGLTGISAIYYIYDKKGNIDIKKLIIGAFLIPIIYGGLIEVIQDNFIEGRGGDWYDFWADTLGSVSGLLVAFRYRDLLLIKSKSSDEKNIPPHTSVS